MAFVQVAPKLATKAERGQLIRFKINGPAGPQVTVAGKSTDPDADWIAGSANSGSFFVCVPMSTTVGEDYEYEIDVNGIGFLDPEVRIKK